MKFGAFCPLPIRLGGDWPAAAHARMCADRVGMSTTEPFARLTFDSAGPTITRYNSKAGNGTPHLPTVTSVGTGVTRFVFPRSYTDENGTVQPVHIAGCRVSPGSGSTPRLATWEVVETASGWQVTVYSFDSSGTAADSVVTLTVVGAVDRDIGDYGGALDKTDNETEVVPYAWTWYLQLEGGIGSGFTTDRTGLVHARKLAIARSLAGLWRGSERLAKNALPGTAADTLGRWVQVLGVVQRPGEREHAVRQRAAERYKLSSGPTLQNEDARISALLGDAYVRNWRQEGTDLATPPTLTFWPVINAGPTNYNLSGAGAWISERAHLLTEVQFTPGMSRDELLFLTNVELFRLVDDMLPAWATADWSMNVSGTGFLLDISDLDFDGMTP